MSSCTWCSEFHWTNICILNYRLRKPNNAYRIRLLCSHWTCCWTCTSLESCSGIITWFVVDKTILTSYYWTICTSLNTANSLYEIIIQLEVRVEWQIFIIWDKFVTRLCHQKLHTFIHSNSALCALLYFTLKDVLTKYTPLKFNTFIK